MTNFKPEVANSNLPRGFRPVRLNLNNTSNQPNQFGQQPSENIYDEPCSNFETNSHHQVPPPLPSSQPPVSSTINQPLTTDNNEQPSAQPFWSLPSQEQEQLQRHLQQHLSRSPTPTLGGQNPINADNIQKVITDKEPPANAEFLYETDAYKFYTIPAHGGRNVMTIKQQNNFNRKDAQGIGPMSDGIPSNLRTGSSHRHGSEWYKTMYKNMHITDKPKWMYEEPIKIKKSKKPKKENIKIDEPIRSEYIYDNQQPINQYQYITENERRKKELQREVQMENPFICDDSETKYVIKKKKPSKSKSPVSRKTYAMIQKGEEDIPLGGLNRPAPKSKNKVGFYEEKQQEQSVFISRSPSPACLTYPASDYVPERPPTPQYISQQQQFSNQQTTTTTTINQQYHQSQYSNQATTLQPPPDRHQIYRRPSPKPIRSAQGTRERKETDFTAIDEWQRKITDDFNQLYSNLERNFELKKLRDTGKLVSPVPPSESYRREVNRRTAKDLYLDQTVSSPKPPSRKYYLEPTSNKPLSASDLFNEDSYKSTKYNTISNSTSKYNTTTTGSTTRNWLDSSNKLNRYNSSQDLNYTNPNNKSYYDFNNNLLSTDNESYNKQQKSTYQHSSLDNLLNVYNANTSDYQPTVHNYSYKIYAQPTTTRTYTESTYYDTANASQPVIDLKGTKTTNSFQFQKQTSLLDIEKQLNEQFGDLLRSTSSFDDRRDHFKATNESTSPLLLDANNNNINSNTHHSTISNRISNSTSNTINITKPNSPSTIRHQLNLELEKLSNTVETSNRQASSELPLSAEPIAEPQANTEQQIPAIVVQPENSEQSTETKAVPFDLKLNQDVNNISFQTTEEEVDSYDKLIKKIEQDAILQDEEIGMY